MNSTPRFHARRATLEDLPVLRPLWNASQLDPLQLEKRLTDFQVVETAAGGLAAAIGLHVDAQNGRIHSECFLDLAQAAVLRAFHWERLQAVSRNRGLVRLWTQDIIPFWRERGFADAGVEIKKKFPPAFGDPDAAWLTFKLKEELALLHTADQEFELLRQTSKNERERRMRQGRIMKGVATLLALMLFITVIIGGVLLYKKNRLHVPFSGSSPAKQR